MSEKLTIEEMQRMARRHNGRCLSNTYINLRTKLKWKCSKGHVWKALPHTIRRDHWCPQCGRDAMKTNLQEMRAVAATRGGKVLSGECIDGSSKLLFSCSKGHKFYGTARVVKAGSWCPECSRIANQPTMEEIHTFARIRGWKCRSSEFINEKTKLEWQCSSNHKWKASWYQVRDKERKNGIFAKGTGCPHCPGKGGIKKIYWPRIDDMRKIAQERGGHCLSNTYINSMTKLLWMCAKGHTWYATPSNIKKGSWCPYCSERKKLSIDYIRRLANSKLCVLLSDSYKNSNEKLSWQCLRCAYLFNTTVGSFRLSGGCPRCSKEKAAKNRLGRKYRPRLYFSSDRETPNNRLLPGIGRVS